jgi:hypothetical protein
MDRFRGIILGLAVFAVTAAVAAAQVPEFSVAQTLPIGDTKAVDGDIVSLATDKASLGRAAVASDQRMYGVLVASPVVVYRTNPTIPVARDGIAKVNVTNLTGPIKVGDFVTSSPIAGKGQKSPDLTGYMLGTALEAFDGSTGTKVDYQGKSYYAGSIKVLIGIGPSSPILTKASGGFFGALQQISSSFLLNLKTNKSVDRWIRYVIALLIIAVVTFFNFRTFGRNVTKGIEAIGRNPLAKLSIQSMIVVNIVVLVLIELAAVALGLIIITL